MAANFEIIVGRIETLPLDAVVNAANRMLLPGTGVDGALRAAAGPELTKRTSQMPPIDIGEAVLTPGYELPARYIIHTAAPIFAPHEAEDELISGLSRCYVSALTLAGWHGLSSIAFPCLGTGNFGWPRALACDVAIEACGRAAGAAASISRIVFCCFTEADAAPYRARLG